MDWLLQRYGGTPSAWLREPREWVNRLLLVRNYRHKIAATPRGNDG